MSTARRATAVEDQAGPAPPTRTTGWARRLTYLGCLLVASLPQFWAIGRARRDGWRPISDNARIAAQAVDTASGHPALLGVPSTSLEGATGIEPIFHPGPAATYVLALGHGLVDGPTGLLVGALIIGVGATALALAGARALGRDPAMLLVTGVLTSVSVSLGVPVLGDIWNPHVPLVPLIAAVLVIWAYALVGWSPGLIWGVALGSFCAQTHLTHLPLLVGAVAPLVLFRLGARRGGWSLAPLPRSARLVVGAAVTAVPLWIPPLWAELTLPQSNVRNLVRAIRQGDGTVPFGSGYATRQLTRTVAVPPPLGPRAGIRLIEFLPTSWSLVAAVTTAALVGAVLAAGYCGVGRRDGVTAGMAASLLGLLGSGFFLLRQSTYLSGAGVYQTRWLWALAGILWAGLLLAVGRTLRPAWFGVGDGSAPRGSAVSSAPRRALAVMAVVAILMPGVRYLSPSGVPARVDPSVRTAFQIAQELLTIVEGEFAPSTPLTIDTPVGFPTRSAPSLELAANLLIDGYDVEIATSERRARKFLGPTHESRGAIPRDRTIIRVVSERDDGAAEGVRVLGETPALTDAQSQELAGLRRRYRAILDRKDVRWTGFGAVLHLNQDRPDPDQLLIGNRLELAVYQDEIVADDLPTLAEARRYSDLSRLDDPNARYVVVEVER